MTKNEWFEAITGRPAAWWMAAVQQAVQKASTKGDDPNHDETDVVAFLGEVVRLVSTSLPEDEVYDGNMRAAGVLAAVLTLWYGRLGYAKSHDPNRPIAARQRSYAKWLRWVRVMATLPIDESDDAVYFSGQQWDFPFSFDAKDGDFV